MELAELPQPVLDALRRDARRPGRSPFRKTGELEALLGKLAIAGVGERRKALNFVALRVGGLVKEGEIAEGDARERLTRVATTLDEPDAPFPRQEIEKTIDDAF